MKYRSLLFAIALMFTNLHSMEQDDLDNSESSTNQVLHQPETLVNIVSKFLARKLIDDINLESEGENYVGYEEYLASCPLNENVKQLILKALLKFENKLLWEVLPYNVNLLNLEIVFKDLIMLENDQLLVLYDEPSGRINSNKISKIKIWNMKDRDWNDIDIQLPKNLISKILISKDLKTLFLLYKNAFLLVYDLINNKEMLKITSLHNIKSISLLNNDEFICCGLKNGKVRIFDIKSGDEIFSFQTGQSAIQLIDSIGDLIITADLWSVKSWELCRDESSIYNCRQISSLSIKGDRVVNMKLGSLNGETIIIKFWNKWGDKTQFLETSHFKVLKQFSFCPSHKGLNSTQDNKMLLVFEDRQDLIGNSSNMGIKALSLLDAGTGDVIRRFDFDEDKRLLVDNRFTVRNWEGLVISPNNDFIALYYTKGQIAKISLNLYGGLEEVLKKVKSHFEKANTKSNSNCLLA